MTITGQQKISIYDPATGTVVQLNLIAEDGEFEKTGSYIQNSQGGRMYSGDESKAEFISYDWSGYDQLETWMKERTPVRFVTYGLDEHILWYEDTYITVDKKTSFTPYGRSGFTVYFERSGGVHNIYKGANILYSVLGFKDADSDGLADGYTLSVGTGSLNPSFSGTTQVIDGDVTASDVTLRGDVVYPVSGASIRAFVGSCSYDGSDVLSSALSARGYSGVAVISSFFDADGNGDVITPAGTYRLRYALINNSAFAEDYGISFSIPYLGTKIAPGEILY